MTAASDEKHEIVLNSILGTFFERLSYALCEDGRIEIITSFRTPSIEFGKHVVLGKYRKISNGKLKYISSR